MLVHSLHGIHIRWFWKWIYLNTVYFSYEHNSPGPTLSQYNTCFVEDTVPLKKKYRNFHALHCFMVAKWQQVSNCVCTFSTKVLTHLHKLHNHHIREPLTLSAATGMFSQDVKIDHFESISDSYDHSWHPVSGNFDQERASEENDLQKKFELTGMLISFIQCRTKKYGYTVFGVWLHKVKQNLTPKTFLDIIHSVWTLMNPIETLEHPVIGCSGSIATRVGIRINVIAVMTAKMFSNSHTLQCWVETTRKT